MKRLLLYVLMFLCPATTHAETMSEKADRWIECAERQRMILQWDNGNRDQIMQKYGSYAENIIKSSRFILHMRVDDPEATDGFRYHCPIEYHLE